MEARLPGIIDEMMDFICDMGQNAQQLSSVDEVEVLVEQTVKDLLQIIKEQSPQEVRHINEQMIIIINSNCRYYSI